MIAVRALPFFIGFRHRAGFCVSWSGFRPLPWLKTKGACRALSGQKLPLDCRSSELLGELMAQDQRLFFDFRCLILGVSGP
ncbi:hypothetical protein MPNT_40163 [Candidatus Methylacidithermus pantelleriae]|uniref:Uncharacterized protein n=1 Tax=Candidatus Methylacidithermus pantelleriae TaxID=2744239 RepID=A0A8J2BUF0_9BACT|nr:hypothetical protein MPNT_40163 [Candidatus Methylacidithermus pantelleriae]